jgi:hypothetical protein
MPPALFVVVILERGVLLFCPGYFWLGQWFSCFVLPTGVHHHTQLLVEMGSHDLFASAGLKMLLI